MLNDLGVEQQKVRQIIDSILGRNERIIIAQIIPTSRVKKVIQLAFAESKEDGSDLVDTGHLLRGLLREGEGIAAHVLVDLGATYDRVVERIGQLPPDRHTENDASSGTPHAARDMSGMLQPIVQDAIRIAMTRQEPATTEHLLLALSRAPSGRASQILADHGLTPEVLEKLLDVPPAA